MKIHDQYFSETKYEQIVNFSKESVYVEADIVFVEDRIIVSKTFKLNIIKLLYKGYTGISNTIKYARTLFYWSNLPSDFTVYIETYGIWAKYMLVNYKEPFNMPCGIP